MLLVSEIMLIATFVFLDDHIFTGDTGLIHEKLNKNQLNNFPIRDGGGGHWAEVVRKGFIEKGRLEWG